MRILRNLATLGQAKLRSNPWAMISLDRIRGLIGDGKVREALAELLKLLESNDRRTRKLRDGVIILHSQFQELRRRETFGLIDTEDLFREKARINDALLNLLEELETGVLPAEEPAKTSSSRWYWLGLLLIPLVLLWFFKDKILTPRRSLSEPEKRMEPIAPARPDLIFEDWTCRPDPVVKGRPAAIRFVIKNNGAGEAADFRIAWQPDIRDPRPARTWTVDRLAPGESQTFTLDHTWTNIPGDNVTARLQLDPDGRLPETNRADNTWERIVSFRGPSTSTSTDAANKQDQSKTPGEDPSKGSLYGAVKDPRDGQTYKTIRLGGKTWLAENMNYRTDQSWCYGENPGNCRQYGRLYSLEAAKEACSGLGAGWHLPSAEDWRNMTRLFGGSSVDSNDSGKSAFRALVSGGASGFNALLGGQRADLTNQYEHLETGGSFWSSTPSDRSNLYYYFYKDKETLSEISLYRNAMGRSCRCVKD